MPVLCGLRGFDRFADRLVGRGPSGRSFRLESLVVSLGRTRPAFALLLFIVTDFPSTPPRGRSSLWPKVAFLRRSKPKLFRPRADGWK